jgi:hypothetical protein
MLPALPIAFALALPLRVPLPLALDKLWPCGPARPARLLASHDAKQRHSAPPPLSLLTSTCATRLNNSLPSF